MGFLKSAKQYRPASALKDAIYSALVLQLIILLLASLVLDGGVSEQLCLNGAAAFWGGTSLLLLLNRGRSLPKWNLWLIKYGYLAVPILWLMIGAFVQ